MLCEWQEHGCYGHQHADGTVHTSHTVCIVLLSKTLISHLTCVMYLTQVGKSGPEISALEASCMAAKADAAVRREEAAQQALARCAVRTALCCV